MKFRFLFISLLTYTICLCQLNLVDTNKYSVTINKLFPSNTSYGWFTNYLNNSKNYYDFLKCNDNTQFYYFRIDKNYDTLKRKLLTFQNPIESFISTDNSFFVITSYKTTMGERSEAFLSKYDDNWNKLWTKTIIQNNIPDDNFVMTQNIKKELLIFSKQYLQNSARPFKVFEKRDLNGKVLHKQKIELSNSTEWFPNNVIQTLDSNLLLISILFNVGKQKSVLELQKITQEGKIIWTKHITGIQPTQTLIQSNGNIILYGTTSYKDSSSQIDSKQKLAILVLDKNASNILKKTIQDIRNLEAGSVSETVDGNLVFSSMINPSYASLSDIYLFEMNAFGEIVYSNIINNNATSERNIVLPQKEKYLLSNTQYYPTWGYSHNCFLNFVTLTLKK